MTEAFTIPDTSPIFSYFPYGDGSPTGGWKATFAAKGDGSDQTLHLTQAANASVSFNVQATSLTIHSPFSSSCSSTITINGTSPVSACSTNSAFYTFSGLPNGTHKVVWSAGGTSATASGVQFWGVEGSRGVPDKSDTIMLDDSLASHLSLIASSVTADASLVPSIIYDQASSWSSIVETPTGYNATGPSSSDISLEETVVSSGSYYNNSVSFTEAAGDKVTIRFQGYSIGIYGAVGPDHGSMDVSVNGHVVISSANLTTPWRLYNQILFLQSGLDPSVTTTVQLSNDKNNLRMTLDYAVIRAPQSTADLFAPSLPNSNEGFLFTITGKVVVYGVIPLLVVLIVFSALWYWCRFRASRSHKWHKSPKSIRSEGTNVSSAIWYTSAEKAKKGGAQELAQLWPPGHAPQTFTEDRSPHSGSELLRSYSKMSAKETLRHSGDQALRRSASDRSGVLPYRARSETSSSNLGDPLAASLSGMDPSTVASTSQSLMELLRAALAFQSITTNTAENLNKALPPHAENTHGSPSSIAPHHCDIIDHRPVSPSTASQLRRSAATTALGASSILSVLGQPPASPAVVPPWPAHIVDSSRSAGLRSLASTDQEFPRPASRDYEIRIGMRAYSTAPSSAVQRRNSVGNDTDIMPSDSVSSVGSPDRAKRGWVFETSYEPGSLSDIGVPLKPFVARSTIASSDARSRYTSSSRPIDPFADDETPSATSPLRPLPLRVPAAAGTTARSASEVSSSRSHKPESRSSVSKAQDARV